MLQTGMIDDSQYLIMEQLRRCSQMQGSTGENNKQQPYTFLSVQNSKIQIVTKLKNISCDQTQKLKL